MIAKIKLIYVAGPPEYVFKRNIAWTPVIHGADRMLLQPQVGMTVIIPHGKDQSFRFYITHIVADLRGMERGNAVLVERRTFSRTEPMEKLAEELRALGWQEEEV